MNEKQKMVLWTGVVVFLLMGLFPPIKNYRRSSSLFQKRTTQTRTYTVKYSFLLDMDGPLAISNLLVQWIVLSGITASLIYTLKDKKTPFSADKQENPKRPYWLQWLTGKFLPEDDPYKKNEKPKDEQKE